MDTSDEEFNENWEFAISEVIVSLDDKVCKKKEVIQEQLCDLDKFRNYLSERKQRLTRTGQHKISKLNHQTNDSLSKSFDQGDNMTNFINNKHLKKSVKWDEWNLKSKVDLTEEIEFFIKDINSVSSPKHWSESRNIRQAEIRRSVSTDNKMNFSSLLSKNSVC